MLPNASQLLDYSRAFRPSDFVRCSKWAYRASPLGMGFGKTRFASPDDEFQLLYIAADLPTAIAETVVRDRFEGTAVRELTQPDIKIWGACSVSAIRDLTLLDLRGDGCFQLGVSTDIVGAKAQDKSRAFSQHVYDVTKLDGIIYASRILKRDCIAVYDRAVGSGLLPSPMVELLRLANLVPALEELKIELVA